MLDFNEPVKNEWGGAEALPADTYLVSVESFRMKRSKKGGIMPSFLLRVKEGVRTGFEQAGRTHFEDLWLGPPDDTEGENPASRNRAGYKDKYTTFILFVREGLGGYDNPRKLHGEPYYNEIGDLLVGTEMWVRFKVKHEAASEGEDGRVYEAKDRNEIIGVWGENNPKRPGFRANGPAGRAVPRAASPMPFTIETDD